jgi:hypothetical protein
VSDEIQVPKGSTDEDDAELKKFMLEKDADTLRRLFDTVGSGPMTAKSSLFRVQPTPTFYSVKSTILLAAT